MLSRKFNFLTIISNLFRSDFFYKSSTLYKRLKWMKVYWKNTGSWICPLHATVELIKQNIKIGLEKHVLGDTTGSLVDFTLWFCQLQVYTSMKCSHFYAHHKIFAETSCDIFIYNSLARLELTKVLSSFFETKRKWRLYQNSCFHFA